VPVLELAEQTGLSELIGERVDLPSTRVKSGAVNPAGKLTSIPTQHVVMKPPTARRLRRAKPSTPVQHHVKKFPPASNSLPRSWQTCVLTTRVKFSGCAPTDEALPIWIDGTSRPRLRRAARFGDGHTGPADTDTWQTYREELENLGKDPTTARRPSRNQWLAVSMAKWKYPLAAR
jgi:hypothetical protein